MHSHTAVQFGWLTPTTAQLSTESDRETVHPRRLRLSKQQVGPLSRSLCRATAGARGSGLTRCILRTEAVFGTVNSRVEFPWKTLNTCHMGQNIVALWVSEAWVIPADHRGYPSVFVVTTCSRRTSGLSHSLPVAHIHTEPCSLSNARPLIYGFHVRHISDFRPPLMICVEAARGGRVERPLLY